MNAVPENPSSPLHAAVAALHRGELTESEHLARQALAQNPDDFDAWHLLAVLALRREDLESAEQRYREALRRRADDPQALNGLGAIALFQGRLDEAESLFRRILTQHPGHPEATQNLASLLLDQERPREALPLLDALIEGHPRPMAYTLRGRARWLLEDIPGSLEDYRRAVSQAPELHRAWLGLGVSAIVAGELDSATEALERARQAPEADTAAKAIFNLAHLHYRQGRYHEAALAFEESAATLPEGRFGLAMTQLLMGDFRQGWRNWRHRPSRQRPGPWSEPEPLAEDLPPQDILVVHDEGPGDELFFLRFLPWLVARGHRVSYLPSELLAPLVQDLPGIHVLPPGPLPNDVPDRVYLTGDLAELVQSGVTGPFPPPLRLPVSREAWQAMHEHLKTLGPPPYIGLSWHSGEDGEGRGRLLNKSAPPELIAQALRPALQEGHPATLIAVMRQDDPQGRQAVSTLLKRPVHHFHPEAMVQLLALIDHLDDLISVPSTNVHLRASLARPARILIPHPPEWRWGMMSQVSPWFPHFRLYREDSDGWSRALERLSHDLQS